MGEGSQVQMGAQRSAAQRSAAQHSTHNCATSRPDPCVAPAQGIHLDLPPSLGRQGPPLALDPPAAQGAGRRQAARAAEAAGEPGVRRALCGGQGGEPEFYIARVLLRM